MTLVPHPIQGECPMSKFYVSVRCQVCDKPFLTTPVALRHGRGKHCSRFCQYKTTSQLATIRLTGKIKESSWETRICPICHEPFRVRKVLERVYCSPKCGLASPARIGLVERMNENRTTETRSASAKTAWQDPEIRQRTMLGIAERSKSPEWMNAEHFQTGSAHP